MHQYTAYLANRMAEAGHEVSLITTSRLPRDRYDARVRVITPVANRTTGFGREGLDRTAYRRVVDALAAETATTPRTVVHFTGPHLWNVPLLARLARAGVPSIQTLHDLDPHRGVRFRMLIRVWNRLVIHYASRVLVHAQSYRERLLARGLATERVVSAPLLHLFLASTALTSQPNLADDVTYEPFALFFGRLERYKGIETLLAAAAMLNGLDSPSCRVVLAGDGPIDRLWAGPLGTHVELLNGHIDDAQAVDLFRRCRLVVLPYTDASQSALIAAAHFFRKPVIVTRSGALPEYVSHGHTGYIVEPDHPAGLARSLADLLASPDRAAAMGAAGRAWYESEHLAEASTLLAMVHDLAVGAWSPRPGSPAVHHDFAAEKLSPRPEHRDNTPSHKPADPGETRP